MYLVRDTKGFVNKKKDWIKWCKNWQAQHLDQNGVEAMEQLRKTRDYDTHTGTIVVSGEIAGGLFPLVFVDPVKSSLTRKELVTITRKGLEVVNVLIATHANFP